MSCGVTPRATEEILHQGRTDLVGIGRGLIGKQVTLVEMLDSVATDVDKTSPLLLIFNLDELGVKIRTKATAQEITDRGVMIGCGGKQEFIEADTVVLTLGAQPN